MARRQDSPVERFRRCLAPRVRGFLDPHPPGYAYTYPGPKMIRLVTRGTSENGHRSWDPFGWFCNYCGRLELDAETGVALHFGPVVKGKT